MSTVQEVLDLANPNSLADMLRKLQTGQLVSGLIPRRIERSGLASSATHVEPEAGLISMVEVGTATLVMVGADSTAGAGEVNVTYDAEGVATLVFGDGANTAYDVTKMVLPTGTAGSGLGAELAADADVGL